MVLHSLPRMRRTGRKSRASAISSIRLASNQITNSPPHICMTSRELVITRTCRPVAASLFEEIDVRRDSCSRGLWGVVGVFMPCSVPAAINLLNIQKPEFRI